MGIYLNRNNTDFYNTINHSEIYVDKTMMLEQTNKLMFGEQRFVCISRPRRFGKSIAANMLTAYYSRGCDSKELFAPYKISQADSFEKHLNKYNVIRFDMQKFIVKTKSVEEMLGLLEQKLIRELKREYQDFIYEDDDLMYNLESAFSETGTPFVFVIDEWDCVLRYYNSESEQKKYLDYL